MRSLLDILSLSEQHKVVALFSPPSSTELLPLCSSSPMLVMEKCAVSKIKLLRAEALERLATRHLQHENTLDIARRCSDHGGNVVISKWHSIVDELPLSGTENQAAQKRTVIKSYSVFVDGRGKILTTSSQAVTSTNLIRSRFLTDPAKRTSRQSVWHQLKTFVARNLANVLKEHASCHRSRYPTIGIPLTGTVMYLGAIARNLTY